MYQPVAYSPVTAISAAIGVGDTTITVDNGSALGDAPNIAVIGATAENSETIVYGTKNGNILGNVQRGVQGIAKSWAIGDLIARNFTALDQSSIQDNINGLNSSKVEKTGDTMAGQLKINGGAQNPLELHTTTGITFQANYDVSNDKFDIYQASNVACLRKYISGGGNARTELQLRPVANGIIPDNAVSVAFFNDAGSTIGFGNIWSSYNLPITSGSWTASIYTGAFTLTTTTARYQRIGNIVFIWASLNLTPKNNTDTSALGIGGLPYAANSLSFWQYFPGSAQVAPSNTAGLGPVIVSAQHGQSVFNVLYANSDTITPVCAANTRSEGATYSFSFFYPIG